MWNLLSLFKTATLCSEIPEPFQCTTTMGPETKDKKKKYRKPLVSITFLHTPAFSLHPSSPYMFFNTSPKPPFHLPMQVHELPAEGDWRCRAVLILLNSEEAEWPLHDQNALLASHREMCMRAWVRCACIKKGSFFFFLKRDEKGSATSRRVDDASFPSAPSHTLFIIAEAENLGHSGRLLFHIFSPPTLVGAHTDKSSLIGVGLRRVDLFNSCQEKNHWIWNESRGDGSGRPAQEVAWAPPSWGCPFPTGNGMKWKPQPQSPLAPVLCACYRAKHRAFGNRFSPTGGFQGSSRPSQESSRRPACASVHLGKPSPIYYLSWLVICIQPIKIPASQLFFHPLQPPLLC